MLAVIALMLRDLQQMLAIGYHIVHMTRASILSSLAVVGIFLALLRVHRAWSERVLRKKLKMLRRVLCLARGSLPIGVVAFRRYICSASHSFP
jgi:hypothetical protein